VPYVGFKGASVWLRTHRAAQSGDMVNKTRRPLLSALGGITALVLAASGTATAQAEAAPVTVAVDSPRSGATVAGDAVQVTYTVTSAPGQVVGWTGARFVDSYQSWYFGTSCETGCTATVSFDTTAVPKAPTANGADDYADGAQTITVQASTTGGDSASASVDVVVDNQRPTEKLGAPKPDPQVTGSYRYTATDRLHLEAYPTVRAGGSATAMTFHYLSGGVRSTAPMTPPAVAGGAWTLDLDTFTWSGGSGSGWVRTTDDRGVASIGTMVYYVVDRGMTLTGPTLPDTVDDFTVDAVKLQYSFPTSYPDTFPVQVATYLDGALVEQHPLVGVYTGDPAGVVTARSGGRTPPGAHDLRYVVTDNRGVSSAVDYHLKVNKTLSIAWTRGPGTTTLPGSLELSGTADSVRTPIVSSTFSVDGTILDFWRCTTSECPYHLDAAGKGQPYPEVYTPGEHNIRWEVGTRDGLPLTMTGTVTVLPYAQANLSRRGPATYGRVLTLSGKVSTTGGQPAPGAVVRLQRRPADNSGRWATVATGQSDAAGVVRFRLRAVRSSQFRTVTVTDPERWAGRAGAARKVNSYADLRVTRRPTSGRVGATVGVRGKVAPARPRQRVYLQMRRHRRWVEVAAARPAADGSFAIRYGITRRGTTTVRLLRESSYGLLTTRTAAWSISGR
jgi:acetolactate synthase regulatory subunit